MEAVSESKTTEPTSTSRRAYDQLMVQPKGRAGKGGVGTPMTRRRGEETGVRGKGLVGNAKGDMLAVDAPPDRTRGKVSFKGKRQKANAARWEEQQRSDSAAAAARRRARLDGVEQTS